MAAHVFQLDKKKITFQIALLTIIYVFLFTLVYVIGDYNIVLVVNQWANTLPEFVIGLAKFYTKYGYFFFGGFAILIAILAFFAPNYKERLSPYRTTILGLLFGFGISWAIVKFVIKPFVNRPRPYWGVDNSPDLPNDPNLNTFGLIETTQSFPSGHATAGFGMSGALMAHSQNWGVRILLYLYAISLSFSRVLFALHNPTDVLVGSIIGLICSIGFYSIFEYLQMKKRLSPSFQKYLFAVGGIILILSLILSVFE